MSFVQQSSIDLGSAPSLRPTSTPWTIEAWFKATPSDAATCANDFGGNHCLLMRAHAFGYDVGMQTDGTVSASVDADPSTSYGVSSSPTAYDDGAWHYLAAVRAPGSITLYIDGKQVSQSPTGESTTYYCCENNVALANDPACHCSGFTGSLSEMAFYNYSLSATQIATHYAAAPAAAPPAQHVNYGTVLRGVAGIPETWTVPFEAHHTYAFDESPSCFSPPGCPIDGLTASITWGDSTTSQVSGSGVKCVMQPPPEPMPPPAPSTTMKCTAEATHTYASAGNYSVTLSVAPIGLIVDNQASIGTISCPTPSTPVGTVFPVVDVPVENLLALLIKPYTITYGSLPLTWHSFGPSPGTICAMTSNQGALPVYVTPNGLAPILAALSIATATVELFHPTQPPPVCDWNRVVHNCSLNGDGPAMVRWHTNGFDERDVLLNHSWYNSGPLTYYYNVDTSSGSIDMASALQPIEVGIHTTLISHLSLVEPIAMLQEPPAHLRVRDRSGHATGHTSTGITHGIPNAIYVTGAHGYSAVILPESDSGPYTVTVTGSPRSQYSLSMTAASLGSNELEDITRIGTLGAHGQAQFTFTPNLATLPRLERHRTITVVSKRRRVHVRYATPRAPDPAGREAEVSCIPASGSIFRRGTTKVKCTARDPFGPVAHETFKVVVRPHSRRGRLAPTQQHR
jgi:Concanavalin A-like lectin/glucanases superfamily/HYR domain